MTGLRLRIPDITNEQRVCEFLNLATGALLYPDSLEACHQINVKFPKRKDVKLVMKNKH